MFTVPIEKDVAKKAIRALESDEDYPYSKNYGKSNDIVRAFADEYLKVQKTETGESVTNETVLEAITIPPNKNDEIEVELRRLLRPDEEEIGREIDPEEIPPAPKGKDPEKWREWQKASILKKREKEARSRRDPFLERWGDMIIGWYRNEKKSGKDKNYLR